MKKLAFAAIAVVAAAILTGCTPSNDDVKSACEDKVSQAAVGEWTTAHDEAPWEVVDVKSTDISTNSQSDDEVSVFDVTGTAVLHEDESGSKAVKVSWKCFSQYRNDDKQIAAAISDVSFD
jgi:cytochrome c556